MGSSRSLTDRDRRPGRLRAFDPAYGFDRPARRQLWLAADQSHCVQPFTGTPGDAYGYETSWAALRVAVPIYRTTSKEIICGLRVRTVEHCGRELIRLLSGGGDAAKQMNVVDYHCIHAFRP